MTKPNIAPQASKPAKTGRTPKAKTASPQDKWNPNVPFHVTQEEFWEHIHEIEKGPFTALDVANKEFEEWKKEFLKNRL